jgi:phosphopantothenoylcysteine decarboxylase/phosphopantothenate--cysteine ligase
LAKTTDILEAARGSFVKAGFAAETQDLIPNARDKVTRKGLDLIVANDLTDPQAGFGVNINKVTFIDGELNVEDLPVMTKYEVSQRVLDRVHRLFPA